MSKSISPSKELSGIWKGLFLYHKNHEVKGSKKNYRVQCNEEDCDIDFSQLVIRSRTRLGAVIKLRKCINKHERYPNILSSYQDDCFKDILINYDDIQPLDVNSIFEHKNIKNIISKFVEVQFDNESLWLEESDE